MWSIYDTMILLTGIITALIAILPVANVKVATRAWSALIGGVLILAALGLGSLHSFRYPSFVFIGPVVALLALGAVVAEARKRGQPGDALQFDDQAHGQLPAPPSAVPEESHAMPEPAVATVESPADTEEPRVPIVVQEFVPPTPPPVAEPAPESDPAREAAWREVHDPATPAHRLADLVGAHPEFGAAAAEHPNCYPELRQWIADYAATPR